MPKPTVVLCCVSTGTTGAVAHLPVGACTSVPVVVAQSLASPVPAAMLRAKSVLKPIAWARLLSYHPNKCYSTMMNDYISKGVPILYDGPECSCFYPNWKSTLSFKSDVLKCIEKDILLGRKSGPFDSPPCPNFRSSPLGAFAKSRTGKVRVIHDLSWPPGGSINEYIPGDLCSVSYISIDDAVREVKKRGQGTLMSKLDSLT
jgi:hypothetical protein